VGARLGNPLDTGTPHRSDYALRKRARLVLAAGEMPESDIDLLEKESKGHPINIAKKYLLR
jgi:hypothetical protein